MQTATFRLLQPGLSTNHVLEPAEKNEMSKKEKLQPSPDTQEVFILWTNRILVCSSVYLHSHDVSVAASLVGCVQG